MGATGTTTGTTTGPRPRRGVIGAVAASIVALATAAACVPGGADTATDSTNDASTPADAAVTVRAYACRAVPERGAGLVVAPGRVLTAAHVVAGATSIDVVHRDRVVPAEVVAFDPAADLAVVAVVDDLAPHVPIATRAPTPPFTAEAVVVRDGHPTTATGEVVRRVTIRTEDIHRGEIVERAGYELRWSIEPGDSGAVLVHEGEAVAVVWSRSRSIGDRGWAIDPVRGGAVVRSHLAAGAVPADVDVGRCA